MSGEKHDRDVLLGIVLAVLMHGVALGFTWLRYGITEPLSLSLMLMLGQFIYIVPAIVIAAILRRFNVVIGLIIALSVTFLLAAGLCLVYPLMSGR